MKQPTISRTNQVNKGSRQKDTMPVHHYVDQHTSPDIRTDTLYDPISHRAISRDSSGEIGAHDYSNSTYHKELVTAVNSRVIEVDTEAFNWAFVAYASLISRRALSEEATLEVQVALHSLEEAVDKVMPAIK